MAVLWTPKGPEGEEKAFFAKRNGGESNRLLSDEGLL
jgi:hypothetical protein